MIRVTESQIEFRIRERLDDESVVFLTGEYRYSFDEDGAIRPHGSSNDTVFLSIVLESEWEFDGTNIKRTVDLSDYEWVRSKRVLRGPKKLAVRVYAPE